MIELESVGFRWQRYLCFSSSFIPALALLLFATSHLDLPFSSPSTLPIFFAVSTSFLLLAYPTSCSLPVVSPCQSLSLSSSSFLELQLLPSPQLLPGAIISQNSSACLQLRSRNVYHMVPILRDRSGLRLHRSHSATCRGNTMNLEISERIRPTQNSSLLRLTRIFTRWYASSLFLAAALCLKFCCTLDLVDSIASKFLPTSLALVVWKFAWVS